MKLLYAPASPFARKVRVTAHELNLLPHLELISTAVLPTEHNQQVSQLNPLGKIPVLFTDDGQTLYDSRVICAYLAEVAGNDSLYPRQAHWQHQTDIALADGLLDAALSLRYEQALRPQQHQWPAWIDGQQRKIDAALQTLAASPALQQEHLSAAQISIACALGYLDFRLPDLDWRSAHPALATFQAAFGARPSMRSSIPE